MRDRIIPALVTLIAGAVTCIIDIYRNAKLLPSLKRLLLVLIIFYIIGLIAKAIIKKVFEYKPNIEEEMEVESNGDKGDTTENNNVNIPEKQIKENLEANNKD